MKKTLLLFILFFGISHANYSHSVGIYKTATTFPTISIIGTASSGWGTDIDMTTTDGITSVSYTHLDVYKRQLLNHQRFFTLNDDGINAYWKINF